MHSIVAGTCGLRFMAEARSVTAVRIVGCSGKEFVCPHGWHNHHVAQVGVASTAEMRVAETDDGGIGVLVARAILVGTRLIYPVDVVRNRIRIRT